MSIIVRRRRKCHAKREGLNFNKIIQKIGKEKEDN